MVLLPLVSIQEWVAQEEQLLSVLQQLVVTQLPDGVQQLRRAHYPRSKKADYISGKDTSPPAATRGA
jgi:hypothetical protein